MTTEPKLAIPVQVGADNRSGERDDGGCQAEQRGGSRLSLIAYRVNGGAG